MSWYKAGTVAVTANSAIVAGSGTAFVANAQIGEAFRLKGGSINYEITDIVSNTELTIDPPYLGTNQTAQEYVIVPVKGFPQSAATALQQAITTFGGHLTGALAGLFGDGSAGASGLGFKSAPGTGWLRKANGDMAGQRNGTELLALESGQVRVKKLVGDAVQSSLSDSTAGRAQLNGGHGSGGTAIGSSDLNSLTVGTMFFGDSTTLNMPAGITNAVGWHARRTADIYVQVLISRAGSTLGQTFTRAKDGTVWSAWKRLDAERGSGPNGEWVRFPDGTQICTHKLAAAASGWQTWAFPAVFIDTDARLSGMAAPGLAPRSLSAGAVTTTTLDFACFIADTGVQSAAFCNLTVVGRWF